MMKSSYHAKDKWAVNQLTRLFSRRKTGVSIRRDGPNLTLVAVFGQGGGFQPHQHAASAREGVPPLGFVKRVTVNCKSVRPKNRKAPIVSRGLHKNGTLSFKHH